MFKSEIMIVLFIGIIIGIIMMGASVHYIWPIIDIALPM